HALVLPCWKYTVYTPRYTLYTEEVSKVIGAMAKEKYISLTTFKRDGTPVATPVWVVSDDGRRLLVWTGASTWKGTRIRRDPQVRVAASDFKGKTRGETYDGVARLLDDSAGGVVDPLLDRKYWL